jgi:hypothetical protein
MLAVYEPMNSAGANTYLTAIARTGQASSSRFLNTRQYLVAFS